MICDVDFLILARCIYPLLEDGVALEMLCWYRSCEPVTHSGPRNHFLSQYNGTLWHGWRICLHILVFFSFIKTSCYHRPRAFFLTFVHLRHT